MNLDQMLTTRAAITLGELAPLLGTTTAVLHDRKQRGTLGVATWQAHPGTTVYVPIGEVRRITGYEPGRGCAACLAEATNAERYQEADRGCPHEKDMDGVWVADPETEHTCACSSPGCSLFEGQDLEEEGEPLIWDCTRADTDNDDGELF